MKMNRTVGLLALAITALLLTQCKKENSNISSAGKPPAQEATANGSITAAKDWLAQQQAALVKSGGAMQFDAAGKFNWNSPINGTDGSTQFIPIATDNKQLGKYLKLTKAANGAITGGIYVYLYPIMHQEVNAYLLEGKKIPADFNGTILEYGLDSKLLATKVYEKGNAVAGKTTNLTLKPAPNQLGGNAAARVVCYEYFMQTYVNGLLVTEVYLYTMCYGTPDDTLETEGGGGGDETASLIAQFNQYVQSESLPEASVTAPTTTPNPEPHSWTHTWTVGQSVMPGAWKVKATTRMDWYHDKYYNMLNNAIEHKFDIVFFKTLNTSLEGNNPLVNTTWSLGATVDNIYDNGTANAHGRANVTGNLKHISVFKVINPVDPFGQPIQLEREYGINGSQMMYAN